MKTSLY